MAKTNILHDFSVILIGSILALSLTVISCQNVDGIHRIPALVQEQPDDSHLKANQIKRRDAYQSLYFTTGATTIRGQVIGLESGIKKTSYYPKLKGEFRIQLEIFARVKSESILRLYQNSLLLAESTPQGEKRVTLKADVELAKNDRITLSAKGEGVLIAGDLILSKRIPVEERNYVFLICADTLRADRLGLYGYKRKTSPNIDSFALDGVVFESAYAQSPWTLPSHMSLFTGLYEFNHGIKRGTTISPYVPYLVEELSQKFSTRSYNGGIYVSANFGFFRGFDFYRSIPQDQISPLATKKLFDLTKNDLDTNRYSNAFYFLHTYQTHSPYNPPLNFLKRFNPDPKYTYLSAPSVGSNHKDQYKKLPQEMIDAYVDLYDAEIFVFDLWFGQFLDYLKEQNIYDDSMIVFMSDHGEEFFDHLGWGHTHSLYNELIRVPLVIKFPKNQYKGTHVTTEVGLIDIMPFILSYYRIPFERKGIDGSDLMPIVKGKSMDRTLISSLTNGFYIPSLPFKISRIENNQKIIFNLPYTDETLAFYNTPPPPYSQFEYYDLLEDPGEKNNIHEEKIAEIRKYRELFELIVQMGRKNINTKDKPVEFDKNLLEALKALGYVH
ncbi:MAG: sulfatase [Candidatus Aminicenantes bacterium]|nr:MAG: sulfatase [Candidatus Aminicenantes bacterium]